MQVTIYNEAGREIFSEKNILPSEANAVYLSHVMRYQSTGWNVVYSNKQETMLRYGYDIVTIAKERS